MSADIRTWCRENGVTVNDRGPVNKEARTAYENANPQQYAAVDVDVPDLPDQLAGPGVDGELRPGTRPGVAGATGTVKDRTRGALGKLTGGSRGPARRRTGLDRLGAFAWMGFANLAGNTGMVPLARVLAYQAPVAGIVIEKELKGTVADRVLQPVARLTNKGGSLGALLGPPLLTAAITMKPMLYPQLKPLLVECLKEWYLVAAPEIKRMQEREAKLAEELGGIDLGEMVDMLFAPEAPAEPEA
jgi:hypothetical protein